MILLLILFLLVLFLFFVSGTVRSYVLAFWGLTDGVVLLTDYSGKEYISYIRKGRNSAYHYASSQIGLAPLLPEGKIGNTSYMVKWKLLPYVTYKESIVIPIKDIVKKVKDWLYE